MKKLVRISKIISHSGICSRREAENLIENGSVRVNGEVFKEFVISDDVIKQISVLNKIIKKKKTEVWCFNKPKGYVCSNKEQNTQKSFFRLLPKNFSRVVSVGRLDIPSEGLLILTTNPTLSSFLENPKNQIQRKYHVKISGIISNKLEQIKNGINIDGISYEKIDFIKIKENYLEMTLIEGKNREIRKIMNFFNLNVLKLKRIKYGPFSLGNLKSGEYKKVSEKRLISCLKVLGFKDACNFW
jgi:23S rRNA pseudouridine2605 synthase